MRCIPAQLSGVWTWEMCRARSSLPHIQHASNGGRKKKQNKGKQKKQKGDLEPIELRHWFSIRLAVILTGRVLFLFSYEKCRRLVSHSSHSHTWVDCGSSGWLQFWFALLVLLFLHPFPRPPTELTADAILFTLIWCYRDTEPT